MSIINYAANEINCKIVYYGAGLCGKTTNLQYLYENTNPDVKGKMISLATEQDRTLFFDFMPLELGKVKGFKVRMHLYTVPGQVYYAASRKMVLRGVDGVVFVADSQDLRFDANIQSLQDLEENLIEMNRPLETIPHVIQYNKQDLPDLTPIEELQKALNRLNAPYFPAVAVKGIGVVDTLKTIGKMVMKSIAQQ